MKVMNDLYEILEDELKKIAKKADISPQELENAYKAVDIMKDIETIKAMKEAGQGGYSQQNSNRGSYNSYDGNMSNQGSYGPVWNQDMMMPYSMNMSNRGSYEGQSNRGSYEGQSNRGSYNSYNSYGSYDGHAGRDADNDGRYSEDGSYDNYSNARGRDARGRYTGRDGSYDGYSRHSEKERMIDKLETMADVIADPKTKRAIEQCIDKLER